MNDINQIYIYLLNEGTDVWRPVDAEKIDSFKYKIISKNPDPEDEEWEFHTNDIVRCEYKLLGKGETKNKELVAVEKLQ